MPERGFPCDRQGASQQTRCSSPRGSDFGVDSDVCWVENSSGFGNNPATSLGARCRLDIGRVRRPGETDMRETTASTTANNLVIRAQLYEDLVAECATAFADNAHLREKVRTLRDRADHLEIALQCSRQIGTAIGILMASQKITAVRAFDLMRAASQATQRKKRLSRSTSSRPECSSRPPSPASRSLAGHRRCLTPMPPPANTTAFHTEADPPANHPPGGGAGSGRRTTGPPVRTSQRPTRRPPTSPIARVFRPASVDWIFNLTHAGPARSHSRS